VTRRKELELTSRRGLRGVRGRPDGLIRARLGRKRQAAAGDREVDDGGGRGPDEPPEGAIAEKAGTTARVSESTAAGTNAISAYGLTPLR
jgi:hypothetical protein